MTYTVTKAPKRKTPEARTQSSAFAILVTFDQFCQTVEENVHADLLVGE